MEGDQKQVPWIKRVCGSWIANHALASKITTEPLNATVEAHWPQQFMVQRSYGTENGVALCVNAVGKTGEGASKLTATFLYCSIGSM